MNLRPYQEQGQKEIHEAWEQFLRIMFQATTGAGKTVLFVNIIKDFLKKGKRVMLIAHRQELIMQAWQTLYKNKIYGGIIKGDYPTNYALPCQVASIQTLARRSELPHADLVIFDEAHHCQDDNSYGDVLKLHFPNAHVLGVTATPYRLSGQGFTNVFEKLITSVNYVDLRDDGFLVPYKYFVGSFPDLQGVKLSSGDYRSKEAESVMELAPLVESYFEHANGKKGLVFAVNVHHSITVAQQYNDAGVVAEHVDGTTPDDLRKSIFERFKTGETTIIVNVGIATEGTDLPDTDFVQLARPTKSLSMYLQMVGRCFRVPQHVIEGIDSPEQRKEAIAMSTKPNAIILDNAGCWEEHGLPDQSFDWQMHFEGITTKQMKEAVEYIELIEFVAIDADGIKVQTKIPSEIEGMVLVEVNKQIRERVLNITSLKEFDRLMEQHKYIKNIKKKGWTTFFKFQGHCKKHFIDMGDEVWDYMTRKLNDEPMELVKSANNYYEKTMDGIKSGYRDNLPEMHNLIKGLEVQHEKRLEKAKLYFVPKSALRKQRMEYDRVKIQIPKIPVGL